MAEPLKSTSIAANSDRHFRTEHLKADLKSRSVRGGVVTMVSQGCKFGLQLGSNVVLGRLLTPGDYGLVGMVTAIVGFVSMFKDLGLSMATIQRDKIDHRQISTLFWINVGLSVATTLLTAAIAPAIAGFYNEPRLIWITLTLSSGFIFGGLAVQHMALLRRQMRFTTLAVIDLLTLVVSITVAVVSAWFGAGYWALVLWPIAGGVTSAVGAWVMCSWRPGAPALDSGIRSMLAFGGHLTGFETVNYFARNLDNVLIGRYWGAQQLGLYAKAYQLLLLPLQQINAPISAIAIPALSRLVDSPERYRQAYLQILTGVCLLTIPLVVFMIGTADWLVRLVLGPQWSGASSLFILLGILALAQPISNTTGWLFITQDRTRQQLQWGLVGSSLAIISIIAGLPWGAVGVAASYSISGLLIRTPLLFWFVGRTGPVSAGNFYRTIAPSMCASICALLVLLAFRRWIEISNLFLGLTIAFVITTGITLLVLIILPAGRLSLQDFKHLLPLLIRSKVKGQTS